MSSSPPRIRLYTAQGCGHCRQLKSHLQRLKVPFQELDIGRNRRAHSEWQRLGARGVPVLLVGDERLDGYDPKRLDKLLRAAGLQAGSNTSRPPGRRPAGNKR
jgi:glutaredoxin